MGHNKKEVQLIIAEVVFGDHPVYKDMYSASATKFQVSVGNCLNMLKATYQKSHAWFKQSGEGIIPGHLKFANLHHMLCVGYIKTWELMYAQRLSSAIFLGNPSFNPEPINSEPNKNHAEGFLAIIQNKTASMKNISSLRADTSVGSGGIVPGGGMVDNQGGEPEEGEIEEEMASPGMDEEHGEADFDDEMLQHWVHEQDDLGADEFHPDIDMDLMSTQGDQSHTPLSDSRSSFRQSSPYLCPPASSASTTSSGSSSRKFRKSSLDSSLKTPSTKASSVPVNQHSKSQLQGQVSDLSNEAESLLADSSSGKTTHYLEKMDYLNRVEEFDLMKVEMKKQWDELEQNHKQELEVKRLAIELKKAEESAFNSEAETLHLKIQLAALQKTENSTPPPA
ncbi:hypothetical protein EDC04DRAFT_2605957 [Pisolithus marmoratus]|nr:hypothetical protein EDC04DRAFT_2605957 [Pisolithus marmoratus]